MLTRDLIIEGAAGPLPARLYGKPASAEKRDRLLVFFHGGGFTGGDLDTHHGFLSKLAQSQPGLLIFAAHYTLAQVQPFPAAVNDAYAVMQWVTRHRVGLGWSGAQLFVAGVEAGANLATVASTMSRDRRGAAVAGQILLMPMLDASLSSASMRSMPASRAQQSLSENCTSAYRGYLPNAADRTHPYASPLLSSRLRGLPPALILTAQDDPLQDEALEFGARLSLAGVGVTLAVLPPLAAPAEQPGEDGRVECAASPRAVAEIAAFLAQQNPAK
jgi:acetyl esterase